MANEIRDIKQAILTWTYNQQNKIQIILRYPHIYIEWKEKNCSKCILDKYNY